MSRFQEKEKSFKPVIIAISILLVAAGVFTAVFGIMRKDSKKTDDSSVTFHSNTGTTASTSSSSSGNDAVIAPVDDNVPQAISTAVSDRKDGSDLPEGTASKLIKGGIALNRWKASSVISKVTAERIKVSLDVYEKGKKTGEKKDRYMYAAVVETRPSRITMFSSDQFTEDKISGIPAMISGYESKTDEDILFACSNEHCARDGSNPNGHIFYNHADNLGGTVIRNSVLAQQGELGLSLAINQNGKWEYPVKVSLSSSDVLIKTGVTNTVSYTYPVIWNGKKFDHTKVDKLEIKYDIMSDFKIANSGSVSCDRTLIGKIDDNKYAFLISEGFSGGYLVDYMLKDMGAKYAYWGAGGYQTGMYVDGYGVITSNNYIAHGDLFCVK